MEKDVVPVKVGLEIAKDRSLAERLVKRFKEELHVPVIIKLSTLISHSDYIGNFENLGVDGLTAHTLVVGLMVDTEVEEVYGAPHNMVTIL